MTKIHKKVTEQDEDETWYVGPRADVSILENMLCGVTLSKKGKSAGSQVVVRYSQVVVRNFDKVKK